MGYKMNEIRDRKYQQYGTGERQKGRGRGWN